MSNQVSYDPRSYEHNLCNCGLKPEKFRTSMGFEPVTSRYWCNALTNARSHVQTPLKSWIFQAISNCISCIHNCKDHSLLDAIFVVIPFAPCYCYSIILWRNWGKSIHRHIIVHKILNWVERTKNLHRNNMAFHISYHIFHISVTSQYGITYCDNSRNCNWTIQDALNGALQRATYARIELTQH